MREPNKNTFAWTDNKIELMLNVTLQYKDMTTQERVVIRNIQTLWEGFNTVSHQKKG